MRGAAAAWAKTTRRPPPIPIRQPETAPYPST
jgi:hypothetical protein